MLNAFSLIYNPSTRQGTYLCNGVPTKWIPVGIFGKLVHVEAVGLFPLWTSPKPWGRTTWPGRALSVTSNSTWPSPASVTTLTSWPSSSPNVSASEGCMISVHPFRFFQPGGISHEGVCVLVEMPTGHQHQGDKGGPTQGLPFPSPDQCQATHWASSGICKWSRLSSVVIPANISVSSHFSHPHALREYPKELDNRVIAQSGGPAKTPYGLRFHETSGGMFCNKQ